MMHEISEKIFSAPIDLIEHNQIKHIINGMKCIEDENLAPIDNTIETVTKIRNECELISMGESELNKDRIDRYEKLVDLSETFLNALKKLDRTEDSYSAISIYKGIDLLLDTANDKTPHRVIKQLQSEWENLKTSPQQSDTEGDAASPLVLKGSISSRQALEAKFEEIGATGSTIEIGIPLVEKYTNDQASDEQKAGLMYAIRDFTDLGGSAEQADRYLASLKGEIIGLEKMPPEERNKLNKNERYCEEWIDTRIDKRIDEANRGEIELRPYRPRATAESQQDISYPLSANASASDQHLRKEIEKMTDQEVDQIDSRKIEELIANDDGKFDALLYSAGRISNSDGNFEKLIRKECSRLIYYRGNEEFIYPNARTRFLFDNYGNDSSISKTDVVEGIREIIKGINKKPRISKFSPIGLLKQYVYAELQK
jgi:hypothetical protein